MIKVDQRNKMKRKTTQLINFLVLFLNFGFIVSSGGKKGGKKSKSSIEKIKK